MSEKSITVEGAREHNLKNVSVRIPHASLCVVTGLSGSGKSSLAFDTLYAEGQRKYVESLSSYARQFLSQLQKPDVDRIDGLSPAIAIEQRSASANPRSIVATTTEIHDYLRLLFSSAGHQHCHLCGRPIASQSAEQIVSLVLRRAGAGGAVVLLAPLVEGRKGLHADVFEQIRSLGFVRARVDGELCELDSLPALDKKRKHVIEAVVDRLVVPAEALDPANQPARSRLTESVELALKIGDGLLKVLFGRVGQKPSAWEERLFSEKNACPDCGVSFEPLKARHFSFNSPYGACPVCNGLGVMQVFDPALVVPDPAKSIEQGAIRAWRGCGHREAIYRKMLLRGVAAHAGFSLDTPWKDLRPSDRELVLLGSGEEPVTFRFWRGGRRQSYEKPFEGVLPNLARRMKETESEYMRSYLMGFQRDLPCTACRGRRLRPESLACTVGGKNIMEMMALSAEGLHAFFASLALVGEEEEITREIRREISKRLKFLVDVGLGYLTLDRASASLSGGEAQRIRLATQVGSGLTGVLYVLDEPSIGLHQRDNRKLLAALKGLRDQGNTVVVVEHDEETIRAADWLIDLGPGAGTGGGHLLFEGPPAELVARGGTPTAEYLRGDKEIAVPAARRTPGKEWLSLEGVTANNLKDVSVRFPVGLFTCVTGVSGSGKSTLVDDVLRRALFRKFYGSKEQPGAHRRIAGLEAVDKVIVIDQSPIGRTPRSNPATYTGAFDEIRALFARAPLSRIRGYAPGRFSFNVKGGRCESCGGDGTKEIEMNFLPDVHVTCEQCRGRRYNRETLEVKWKGKSIADVLEMTIEEACEFFKDQPRIARKLSTLRDVGLGYLALGQAATTLSGGEAQRMKLSAELAKKDTGKTVYLLDEPTTGLHFADVARLLEVLVRLRDKGNTLIVIEHNLDVIKTADWIVDLGPEGGEGGGEVVAEGTPEEVAAVERSYTGQFLRPLLAKAAKPAENPPTKAEKPVSAPENAPETPPKRQKTAKKSVQTAKKTQKSSKTAKKSPKKASKAAKSAKKPSKA
ncbi:MAG: excinuclease ABC subunit UvrA [Kiritimatiellae bacterium]|nr:excinuclease ABC subunit UvrA [Kiritimatiellia bacterium]